MAVTTLADYFKPDPAVLRNRLRSHATFVAKRKLRENHPTEYKQFRRFQVPKFADVTGNRSNKIHEATMRKLMDKYTVEYRKLYDAELKERGIL